MRCYPQSVLQINYVPSHKWIRASRVMKAESNKMIRIFIKLHQVVKYITNIHLAFNDPAFFSLLTLSTYSIGISILPAMN